MAKGFKVVSSGNIVSYLYFLANTSNNVVNLAPACGKNANKVHHKFEDKSEVEFLEKNKVGKGVSNGKKRNIWMTKVKKIIQH